MTAPLRLFLPLTTITAYSSSSDFPSKSLKSFHSASPNFKLSYSSSLSSHHHTCTGNKTPIRSKRKWLCGHMRRDQDIDSPSNEDNKGASMFGSDEEVGTQIPTQAQSVVEGSGAVLVSEFRPVADVDYLQELLAIQQQGPRAIGFFGTRNMGFMHQELIEILSYAMVITKNHIYTSGASGTNAAVIRGALRAEKPELLTVILPQSLKKQPPESQELLSKVKNVIEKPYNDHLPLLEASRQYYKFHVFHVETAGCAIWTSFHMYNKLYALRFMISDLAYQGRLIIITTSTRTSRRRGYYFLSSCIRNLNLVPSIPSKTLLVRANQSRMMRKEDPRPPKIIDAQSISIRSHHNPPAVDKLQQLLSTGGGGGSGWDKCWEQGLTPWDLGQPTPVIAHLHRQGALPKGRALVPGCGTGYDVVAIASPERHVTGLDISENAIKKAAELFSSLPEARYYSFLKISDHIGGPPYKVSVSDYEEVLHPMGFKATSIVDNELAVPPRKGREKLGRWKRSLSKSSL
ncbi:hypothetical protein ACE6H2_025767 [Prunus campanulata]